MEKLLKPYDKEYMRMAMLKHESTFKQQVCELHRLYRVQKILMKNMEISRSNPNNINDNVNMGMGMGFVRRVDEVDGCDVREDLRTKFDLDRQADVGGSDIDESEIELTLGPSYSGHWRKKKSPEYSPGNSDSRRRLSASSTGSSDNRGNNGTSNVVIKEQKRQERLMNQQPWLQVLSLNVT